MWLNFTGLHVWGEESEQESDCDLFQTGLKPEERYGIKNISPVLYTKRLTLRGFIVSDENMGPMYSQEHQDKVSKWLADGTFIAKMDTFEGIDQAGEALLSLFSGKNQGKVVLRL